VARLAPCESGSQRSWRWRHNIRRGPWGACGQRGMCQGRRWRWWRINVRPLRVGVIEIISHHPCNRGCSFGALGMVSGGGGAGGHVSKVRTGIVAPTGVEEGWWTPAHLWGGHIMSPCSNSKHGGSNQKQPRSPWSGVVEWEFVSNFVRPR
jgi:hypothetical protein